MKPRTIFIIAAACFVLANIGYWHNHLSGGVESRHAPFAVPGRPSEYQQLPIGYSNAGEARTALGEGTKSGSSAPPAQIPDSDAQRVINAFVGAGFSPDDAAEAYRVMTEMVRNRRNNRLSMPGVRTNADLKKFPLFEGEP